MRQQPFLPIIHSASDLVILILILTSVLVIGLSRVGRPVAWLVASRQLLLWSMRQQPFLPIIHSASDPIIVLD